MAPIKPMYPAPEPNYSLLAVLGILLILAIGVCTGCKTPQQLIDRAMGKDSTAVARYTRDKFPCTDVLRPDTAVMYRDTTIYVDCPDTGAVQIYETVVTDTVNRLVTKTVRVPVTVRLPGTTITRWYEDSAKIFIAMRGVDSVRKIQIRLQADTATLRASRDSWKGKAGRRGKENWIWRAIALVFIVWKAWGIYKRATTIKLKS